MNKASRRQSRDDHMDLAGFSHIRIIPGTKVWPIIFYGVYIRPEVMALDFVVRPQSKIDLDEVRACAKQIVQDLRRMKVYFLYFPSMQKKLKQLEAPKKKQLRATKLSIQGRGMVKYL